MAVNAALLVPPVPPFTLLSMGASGTEVVIDTKAVRLVYHVEPKIVHHEIRLFLHGAPLREMLERGAQLLEQHQARKWLSDDRGNGPVKPADEEWAKTQWFPRVCAAGWKHWAVVMPSGVLGQMNMRRWIDTYSPFGINAHPFDSPDEAWSWLVAQTD